jgi:hypothetical protein
MFKVQTLKQADLLCREVHGGDRDRGCDCADDRCDQGSLSLARRRHMRAVHQESEHSRDCNFAFHK